MRHLADATDRNIIAALRPNPRITNKEVAEQLDLAETTVSQRIKLMSERNIMRVVAQKHVFSEGLESLHFIFVNTSGRTVQAVCADMVEVEGIFSVSQGIGNPDIVASACTSNLADAYEISNKIKQLEGTATVEVIPCFRIHKMDSNFADLSNPNTSLPTSANPKDDAVIHAFMTDGRQSIREVARQLCVSEGAVRQRVNKLMSTRQIQFQVVTDPSAFDLGTVAILRLVTETSHTQDVLTKLNDLQDTHFVAEVSGTHNILALTTTQDTLSLGNLCDNELMPMLGVRTLDVQLLVDTYKHQYHLAHFDEVCCHAK